MSYYLLKAIASGLAAQSKSLRRTENRLKAKSFKHRYRKIKMDNGSFVYERRLGNELNKDLVEDIDLDRREAYFERTYHVRRDSRALHLLLSYIKGRNYRDVEEKSYTKPDTYSVLEYAFRYGVNLDEKSLSEWLSA